MRELLTQNSFKGPNRWEIKSYVRKQETGKKFSFVRHHLNIFIEMVKIKDSRSKDINFNKIIMT